MSPQITIALCTRNRSGMLREAVASLLPLETDDRFDFEVLVIDNASTDSTPQVVDEIAASTKIPVRRIYEETRGIVPARNRGVKEARGEWIAFFDDDQLADRRWLAELYAIAQEKGVRCAGGAVDLLLPPGTQRTLSPFCRLLLGETVGLDHPQRYNHRVTPGCGNILLHRSVFDDVGYFDERMSDRGEDTDLFLRMHTVGIEGWFTPKAIVHHRIPPDRLSDEYLMRLAERMSRGMAEHECKACGRLAYPFVWLARVAQAGLVLYPRLLGARLLRDSERAFGARCRLRIAARYLRDGVALILTGTAAL